MSDFIEDNLIALILGFIAIVITFFVYDCASGPIDYVSGEVIEGSFSPDNQETNVGYVHTSVGSGTVVTSSGHSDQWYLIVKTSKEYIKIRVEIDDFYRYKRGDLVTVGSSYGKHTGFNYLNFIK